jgi:hypothetical protein
VKTPLFLRENSPSVFTNGENRARIELAQTLTDLRSGCSMGAKAARWAFGFHRS